jgi:hypothetical protein
MIECGEEEPGCALAVVAEEITEEAGEVAVAQVEVVDREANRPMDCGLSEHPCNDAKLLGFVQRSAVLGIGLGIQEAKELVGVPGVAIAFREELAEVVEPVRRRHCVEAQRGGERGEQRGTA